MSPISWILLFISLIWMILSVKSYLQHFFKFPHVSKSLLPTKKPMKW